MRDRLSCLSLAVFSILQCGALAYVLSAVAFSPLAAQTSRANELIVRAVELYRHGACQEAEPLLQEILLLQPKNIEIRKLLGRCLLQNKKIDAARQQFKLVLDAAPDDAEALKLLNTATAEIQKREEVKQTLALETRAAASEQFRSVHEMRQAEELMKAKRIDEAEQILQGIASRNPAWIPARQRLAEIYSATRRFDKAAEVYRALAEKLGSSSVFWLRLAQNLEWSKNYPEAIQYYRLYLEGRPQDLTALLALANALNWSKHYDQAAQEYRRYLQKRPGDFGVRMTLAKVLMWSARCREAVPELERLRSTRPQDMGIPLVLAECHEQLSEPDLALKAYEQVLELDATNRQALGARSKHLQRLDELPRQKGFAALARGDYEASAKFFEDYLKKHPESTETVLEIARVSSWGRRYKDAEAYYEEYLRRAPGNLAVRRQFAQMEIVVENYAAARKHFQTLIESPSASTEDYELLIHSYTWAGDLEGAEPYAKKLADRDPENPVARETLSQLSERRKFQARKRAEEITAAGRFEEAVAAYRRYMDTYGTTQSMDLMIGRLYSWDKDYADAVDAYRDYLGRYPQDLTARLELANIENWSARYKEAESDYRAVLKADPRNAAATLGIAEVMDRRGDDPRKVMRGFKQALNADPQNAVAQNRVREIHSQVAPRLGFDHDSFADSDGLYWSVNSVEAALSFPGRTKVTPYYTFGYFHQLRLPGETTPEIQALNQTIRDIHGTILANGAGVRFEFSSRSRLSLTGEAGAVRFDPNRTSVNGRGEVSLHTGRGTWALTYRHRDAIYDLNTVASLAAGIMDDTALLSYQGPIRERGRFWISGGASHYTSGSLPRSFSNTRPRLTARLDYQIRPWITLGYALRASGTVYSSPLYFSPPLYQTHGLAYQLSHSVSKSLRVGIDGEVDYGRITRNRTVTLTSAPTTVRGGGDNTFEMAALPNLTWQGRHDISVRLSGRFSQGRASAFSSPSYQTVGGALSVTKVF